MDESQGNYTEWKMPISKIYTVWFHSWDTLDIPTWGWKADQWLPELGDGECRCDYEVTVQGSGSCGDRTVLYIEYGGGYI